MPGPYQIRLIINSQDNGYAAKWVEADGQESQAFRLTPPLSADDLAELRWYLETYPQFPGHGDRAHAAGVEAHLRDWGRALFDAIFGTPEGTHVYRNLMLHADQDEACLLTIGATDPTILTQPWEMLRDQRGPLTFQGVTIRRQLQGARRALTYSAALPLRILLIVSRPTDIGFIDPRNSIAPLLDALDGLPPDQVEVDFCDPPTLTRLEQMIADARKNRHSYHLVHFDGHGAYLPLTGVGALAFEDDQSQTELVPGPQLGDLLARLKIPLVILEACRSADLSDKPVFGSVAPALLQSGVGSVVAFSHSVHIDAARLCVARFYREIVGGQSIGQALEEARVAVHTDRRRRLHLGPNAEAVEVQDWFTLQLYQVGADLALVKRSARARKGETAPAAPTDITPNLHGFPPPPLYRFHGRAQELLRLERAFLRHNAVLLSGMGGMGKTALSREAAAWWRRTGRFDQAVFVSFEQRAGAERVVQVLGQALAGDEFSARPAEQQWRDAVALFHHKRVLLVWDNFESTLPAFQKGELSEPPAGSDPSPAAPPIRGTSQDKPAGGLVSETADSPLAFSAEARARLTQLYRDLTAGAPQGRLLITCRPAETGLSGLKIVALEGLARADALHLLAAILDQKSIDIQDKAGYEREEIEKLLTALDDHPLSIELVAPHLRELSPARIRAEFSQLLARFANEGALEGRNRSLLASLEFSKRRLSSAAQQALPYLAWFGGGVFEWILLNFTNLDPDAWSAIRAELEATALVSVESLPEFTTSYLRFHPTLPYAAHPTDVPDANAVEQRFIAVYLAVRGAVGQALYGHQPAAGMALMAREEGNFHAAIRRAFQRGDRRVGALLSDILRRYLERAGRLRERDSLVAWVRAQMPQAGGLDEAMCAAILDHAWSQFTQGHAAEAIQTVQGLISRLEPEGMTDEGDTTRQLALSHGYLGRLYDHAGRPDLALEPLQQSRAEFESLGDTERGNLAATLGDLANAYYSLGQFDAALAAAERALEIVRVLGRSGDIAIGLSQIGVILMHQQRYAEADARYHEAFRAAQATGDLEQQGITLTHQGILQTEMGNMERAISLYKQAITLFQRANDLRGEMQTCNLLGITEREHDHLDAAEAWYDRSRELAHQLHDQGQLAVVAQNVGILYLDRAKRADDPMRRTALLSQAVALVSEVSSFSGKWRIRSEWRRQRASWESCTACLASLSKPKSTCSPRYNSMKRSTYPMFTKTMPTSRRLRA